MSSETPFSIMDVVVNPSSTNVSSLDANLSTSPKDIIDTTDDGSFQAMNNLMDDDQSASLSHVSSHHLDLNGNQHHKGCYNISSGSSILLVKESKSLECHNNRVSNQITLQSAETAEVLPQIVDSSNSRGGGHGGVLVALSSCKEETSLSHSAFDILQDSPLITLPPQTRIIEPLSSPLTTSNRTSSILPIDNIVLQHSHRSELSSSSNSQQDTKDMSTDNSDRFLMSRILFEQIQWDKEPTEESNNAPTCNSFCDKESSSTSASNHTLKLLQQRGINFSEDFRTLEGLSSFDKPSMTHIDCHSNLWDKDSIAISQNPQQNHSTSISCHPPPLETSSSVIVDMMTSTLSLTQSSITDIPTPHLPPLMSLPGLLTPEYSNVPFHHTLPSTTTPVKKTSVPCEQYFQTPSLLDTFQCSIPQKLHQNHVRLEPNLPPVVIPSIDSLPDASMLNITTTTTAVEPLNGIDGAGEIELVLAPIDGVGVSPASSKDRSGFSVAVPAQKVTAGRRRTQSRHNTRAAAAAAAATMMASKSRSSSSQGSAAATFSTAHDASTISSGVLFPLPTHNSIQQDTEWSGTCPTCGQDENAFEGAGSMVACDCCNDWFHFVCVGYQPNPPPTVSLQKSVEKPTTGVTISTKRKPKKKKGQLRTIEQHQMVETATSPEDDNWYCPKCIDSGSVSKDDLVKMKQL